MRTHAVVLMSACLLALSAAFAEEELKSLVAGNNAFAFDMYSALKKEKENLFFSPYSISSALAMTYGGARGDTAVEMAKALHFALDAKGTHSAFAGLGKTFNGIQKKGQVQLHIANSLWPQKDYPLLPEFLALTKEHYGVSVTPVDYVKAAGDARKVINKWVEDKTQGRIRDLIGPGDLDPLTVLVLVNAIYFKGNWASQFDPKRTAKADFLLPGDAKMQVSMMYQKGRFRYGNMEGGQLLELDYAGRELSMLVVLPSKPDGLAEVERHLAAENLDSWVSRCSQEEVHVYLPKFKVTWGTFSLNDSLKSLGMKKAFAAGADFSGMDGKKILFIALVLHKAFIEVNEEGTEAAAATAVVMKRNGGPGNVFRADRPFLFFIRDRITGSILFLGRVVDPGKESN